MGTLEQAALRLLDDLGLGPVLMENRLARNAPLGLLVDRAVIAGTGELTKVAHLGRVVARLLVVRRGGEEGLL